MKYIAEEIPDKLDLLNEKLLHISNIEGQIISIIWRETDNLYVIVYLVKK